MHEARRMWWFQRWSRQWHFGSSELADRSELMCLPANNSKLWMAGGAPSKPSSFQRAHTCSYISFFSSVRGEKLLMYLNSLHALMMHLEPQGRFSGGLMLGSRKVLQVSRRISI